MNRRLKPRLRLASLSASQRPGGGCVAHADVAEQHRQQDQVGEDQDGDAQAGGERQVLDDVDVDHHQHREADRVGEQRGEAGEEQAAEGVAGGDQAVRAAADVLHDPVHLLRAVAHADGEDEERHQDRIGIELEAEGRHQAEQPDHGDQRAGHHQRGRAHAAGVEPDDRRGDQRRQGEVQRHLHQAVDQVADQLGEADHVQLGAAVGLDPGADLLDRARELAVVDALFSAVALGSLSSSGTTSMLDLKSLPTRLPTMPERAMLARSCSVALVLPS